MYFHVSREINPLTSLQLKAFIFRGLTQRLSMSNVKKGDTYDLWMMDPKNGDDRQMFIMKNKKIYCNAGNRLSDGRQYVLQNCEGTDIVRCGPTHATPREVLEFVSTKVSPDDTQFP